mmetsp:Transcript_20174/g.47020  ORF Transcript_20174/g.47020 Transcript_20174/m.47020 type:complete len:841 (+) Transcript_20174:60-2582(+)
MPSAVPVAREEWPAAASLGEDQVNDLGKSHPGDVSCTLGWQKLEPRGASGILRVVRIWHEALDDSRVQGGEVFMLFDTESSLRIPLHRRCSWLYEAVVEFQGVDNEADFVCPIPVVELPAQGKFIHPAYVYRGSLLSEDDLDKFQSGTFPSIGNVMGSHIMQLGDVFGLRFVAWAPRACFVSVVGDWNSWDGRASPMYRRSRESGGGFTGVWELFLPFGTRREDIPVGHNYGYKIHTVHGADVVRIDPFAQEFEAPALDLTSAPHTNCSRISGSDDAYSSEPFRWTDSEWMHRRYALAQSGEHLHQPMAIYEVHLPSWRRTESGGVLNYRDLTPLLVEHMKRMHFNYVELIGLAHHPFNGSWGYQVTGYYACYSVLGSPDDFKFMVNALHEAGFGVLMDFVPAHFSKDPCGFADYDGTPTYEYEDPREGEQRDWGTKVYNFRRHEVRSFLTGSALFWADRYHIDGFRCDAISSMLYRNFSTKGPRPEGEWLRNEHGTDSNLEAVAFLQQFNRALHTHFPGVLMIAEESHAWSGVTSSPEVHHSGLGFDLKWDLGWMNDTLSRLGESAHDQSHRQELLTRRFSYVAGEKWVVPLSHDEVTCCKGSMFEKMGRGGAGSFYDQVRMLAVLYTFQVSSVGAPLLFMGCEYGQGREWNHKQSLDWHEQEESIRGQLCTFVSDLLGVYSHHPSLHASKGRDGRWGGELGFDLVENNAAACVLAYVRTWQQERPVLAVHNFSNRAHHNYGFRAPYAGEWEVLLNTDDCRYGGRRVGPGNMARLHTSSGGFKDWPEGLWLDVPAEGALLLVGPHQPALCKVSRRSQVFDDRYINDSFELGFDDAWMGC